MKSKNVFVSVVCPIYNEERFIAKCIDSMLAQDFSHEDMEVFFVDGRSTDKTREIVSNYAEKYAMVRLLDNPHKHVSIALNIGIKASNGNVVVRIDGHCDYPANYISLLVKYLYGLNADNVGGVLQTLPSSEMSISKAIALASSNMFGVGDSRFKTGANKIIKVDTVPFGCFKREVFDKIGLFDEELIRNQDDEFNARLVNNGGKIFLIPEVEIKYFAREKIGQMATMYYQYGLFKPLTNKKLGKPATIRQFFPALFLIGLIFGAVLSIVLNCFFLLLYLSVVMLYIIIGVSIGFFYAFNQKNWRFIFLMPYTFFVIHISYGWGYLLGIYKLITKSSFNVEINR